MARPGPLPLTSPESVASTFVDATLTDAGVEYRPELCIPPPPRREL